MNQLPELDPSYKREAARQRMEARKKRRRRARIRFVCILIVIGLVIYGVAMLVKKAPEKIHFELPALTTVKRQSALGEMSDYPAFADSAGISSKCVLLCDLSTGKVICEKNAAETVKIASLTKIMTAVVAIENLPDLDVKYTMSGDIIKYLTSENSAVAGFAEGETVTALDLLYAAMLPSGGDGAMGLAELVGGSQEGFVDMMNAKARELGMNRTKFTNATGFDYLDNYSCAYDLSLLFEYALNNDLFRRVITTSAYTTSATPEHRGGITLVSTVYNGFSENGIDMGIVLGGKTGYTGDAGRCLATYAEKNGEKYILITLGASRTPSHFTDAFKLYSQFVG